MIAQRIVAKNISKRCFASSVTFAQYGDPLNVLNYGETKPIPDPIGKEVVVQILAAPINPSDLNMIQGTYGTLPKLPAVAGKECVAVVKKIGDKVKSLAVGDHVVAGNVTFGTWREEGNGLEDDFLKVSKSLPVPYAASIHVNPCTAYRMLRDFGALVPGQDTVIQNCANSMVGIAVVQMAREMGIRTINVVRSDRPDAEEVVRLLDNLGGDNSINILDTWVNTPHFNEMIAGLPKPPVLALNGVGGDSATEMCRVLAPGGTMVTYGGMSKQPMSLPLDVIVEKQLAIKGFWISKWHEENSVRDRTKMINDITNMILEDKLDFFYEMHDFDDFTHALKASMQPFRLRKTVLNMDPSIKNRFAEHDAKTDKAYWKFEATSDV